MPCNSGMDASSIASSEAHDARRKAEEAIKVADRATAILCKVLRALPPEFLANLDEDTRNWFADHLKHDAKEGR